MKTFVESQFQVMQVYEFQTKANSYEDICEISVWGYVNLQVSKKDEFFWRHSLSLTLELCKFMSFKQKRILPKTFFRSQFKVTKVSEFQTKANSYEDYCWVSVWSYVSLRVSNKSEFLWRHLLSVSLKLCKFMTFKQKRFLLKAFVECQVEVI